jgi:hypothetical protein
MHTYLKDEDGYSVGSWLINRDGYHQFYTLFTVPSLEQAIHAVSWLNGGEPAVFDRLEIKERESK